ncbi:MAG TPA: Yip1 family protein [Vicinamibacterales bacterium]|nr:Yip1 family protein [Vicinamibacterales bacterium]
MDTVTRAKNICLTPNTEWPVIAEEQTPPAALITGYVVPLAAIGAVAGLIGGSLVGISVPFGGTYRVPLTAGLVTAVFTFVMAIVGVFLISVVINVLAPTFGGQQNSSQALKVAVYSYTPAWIAGVLHVLPLLGALGLIAALYGLYLLYLGLPRVMKCPEDKALAYTAVVVVCAIVLAVVTTAVTAAVAGAGMLTSAALSGGSLGGGPLGRTTGASRSASGDETRFDKDSPLGKLQALGDKLEANNKKIEAAQKAGNQEAAASAAIDGLATLFGGGHKVDPIDIDQLKPFVPETFAGLPRRRMNTEKTGIASLMVSKAHAEYGDGGEKRVTLEISDSGGASGLVTLAGWAGMQEERQDESGEERTRKVDGRLVHEKISKNGGSNEFSIVLGGRFVVAAHGSGVEFADLKAAVGQLDLRKLESLKDAGVQP